MTETSLPLASPAGALRRDRSNTLAALTASEFLDLLRRRELSVRDYASACADEIDRLEEDLGAWAWYERDRFEEQAALLDRKLTAFRGETGDAGALPGSMFGVPAGAKDVFNTEDMPTSHGSSLFSEYTPGNDARVVTSLRREHCIIAGKTVTAEFAVHHPGSTRNPHDPARSCGTSSSGSAVAVATGMVPVALASQTSGSTIRPASYCGIYGFKPSYGLFPRTAMLKTTDTLDTVGFMARSVADLTLLFEVMRVRGPNYPIVDVELNDPARRSIGARPWRVALLDGPMSTYESPAAREGIRGLADRLSNDGCIVEDFRLPGEFDDAHHVHETIYRRSLAYNFRMEWAQDRSQFSRVLVEMIENGLSISLDGYKEALEAQARLARRFEEEVSVFDVVICPGAADEAPVGVDSPDPPDHSPIFTMCYAPAMTVPHLRGTSGLPLGVQIASRRFHDYILLDFADRLTLSA